MDIIYRYDPHHPDSTPVIQGPDDAERELREGNRRYEDMVARVQAEVLGGGADDPVVIPSSPRSMGFSLTPGQAPAQTPFALVLGCSDARAPVEIIFDRSSNELFIVRVAGNVLGTECLGSLEYAVRHLARDLRLVVVLGHSGCGAVAAAVDLYLAPDSYSAIAATHSLRTLIDRILFVVRIADKALERRHGPSAPAEPGYRAALWEMAVYLNAALTARDLTREQGFEADGPVRVVYGVYNIATRRVGASPGDDRTFATAPRTTEDFNALSDLLADSVVNAGILKPVDV